MKRAIPALLTLLLAAAPSRAEALRLRDGTLLFGEVLAHEESGVRVRRFDNGGVVDLRWDHLIPEEAERLREAYGYLDKENEGHRVLVDRIRIADGSEIVGLIVENRPEVLVVRVRENTINVPKARIVPPLDRIEVDALVVFTKDQLYNEKRGSLDLTTAPGHLELARFLVRIRDWKRAAEHYRKVKELDPNLHPGEVGAKTTRCEERAAREKEEEALDSIRILRERGRFTEALKACEKFKADFPSTPLARDVEELKKRIVARRAEETKKAAVLGWYELASRIAHAKAGDRKVPFEEAKAYAERELAKEILKQVLDRVRRIDDSLDANAVRALFDGRDVKKLRNQRARYDQGTFALGKEKARAGLEPKEAESKPSAEDAQKKELDEKIRRYLNALKSAQGGASGPALEEPQAWWDRAPSAARGQWLLAYYAEFGGDMKEVRAWADTCRTCGGRGFLEELAGAGGQGGGGDQGGGGGGRGGGQGGGQGSGAGRHTCGDCHGLQFLRYVTFR
jgi:tetratricopeptide (TPR) repeat protein